MYLIKKAFRYIKTQVTIYKIHLGYRIKVNKLRKTKNKITVLFLVNENQKWNCDSLYEALDKSENFSPIVAITKLGRDSVEIFNKNVSFFKNKNINYLLAYEASNDTGTALININPDIVFFQQPYGSFQNQTIEEVSKYALTCYIPYGLMVANNDENHYRSMFQELLWKYFAPNEIIKKLYLENCPNTKSSKIIVSGHPKMDIYDNKEIKNENLFWTPKNDSKKTKLRIIYSPHHSLDPNSPLKYSTFIWNGRELLSLAKESPNIEWVFKPHPRLHHALELNKVMTRAEVNIYYNEWKKLPNASLYDSGDYFDLFRTSDALITDCGSFLAEYLPTKKPIILLINNESRGYNSFGNILVENLYKANNYLELENLIENVIVNQNDTMQKQRLEKIPEVRMPHGNAGKFIVEYLEKHFLRNL